MRAQVRWLNTGRQLLDRSRGTSQRPSRRCAGGKRLACKPQLRSACTRGRTGSSVAATSAAATRAARRCPPRRDGTQISVQSQAYWLWRSRFAPRLRLSTLSPRCPRHPRGSAASFAFELRHRHVPAVASRRPRSVCGLFAQPCCQPCEPWLGRHRREPLDDSTLTPSHPGAHIHPRSRC